MKIQYKLSILIFAIGIITLFVLSIVYYIHSNSVSMQAGLKKLESLSEENAKHIQTHMEERSITAVTLSSAPVIRQVLIQSNKEFTAFSNETRQQKINNLNQKWMETKDVNDPFIQGHLTSPSADYLRQQQDLFPNLYGEIFLTNRFGVMIATTGKLTTLAHAHKYWWIASYSDGKGRIFFDDRGFDTSVKGYVIGIVVPIWEKNEIIGILKCNINIIEFLSHIVEDFADKTLSRAKIIRSGGLVVIEPGREPLSTKIPDQIVKGLLRKEIQSTTIHENGTKQLVATAPVITTLGSEKYGFGGSYESIDHIKGNTGEGWYVATFLDYKQIAIITEKSTRMLILTGIVFLFGISIIALILGKKIARPIKMLAQTTKSIGEGRLDLKIPIVSKDEIGILAESINTMTQNLQREMSQKEQISQQLHNIEWLLEKTVDEDTKLSHYTPPYGNLIPLNTKRSILDSVGEDVLKDIAGDFLDLLDTSSAIYETNGDYALGIFSSGWCRFLDNASRNLCNTNDNQEALDSGLWLCHESCWSEASKEAINTGQPADIECHGGIRLYAIPIFSGQKIIGAINFGYGDPPTDRQKLKEIADKYRVTVEELLEEAKAYETRPKYILDIAKKRLQSVARLIGEIAVRKKTGDLLQEACTDMEQRVKDRTQELAGSNKELVSEIIERERIEEELKLERDNLMAILSSMEDGVYILDQDYNLQYVNPVLEKEFGPCQGQKCFAYFRDQKHACPECKNQEVFSGKTVRWQWYSPKNKKTYHLTDTTLQNPDGSLSKLELFHDITELKQAEEGLKEYAEKQVVLLREVNHRVKNNLITIISMLHQEEDRAKIQGKKEYSGRLQELVGRISGLLTVHSMLSSSMWEPLLLAELCQNIIKGVLTDAYVGKSFVLDVSPSDIIVDSDQAHYLTIVLNELATNSMKYAMLDRDKVHIKVSIHHQDDSIGLTFHDDGPGFPQFVLNNEFPEICIGFHLVFGIITHSLQGRIQLLNDGGAMVKINFPKNGCEIKNETNEEE